MIGHAQAPAGWTSCVGRIWIVPRASGFAAMYLFSASYASVFDTGPVTCGCADRSVVETTENETSFSATARNAFGGRAYFRTPMDCEGARALGAVATRARCKKSGRM